MCAHTLRGAWADYRLCITSYNFGRLSNFTWRIIMNWRVMKKIYTITDLLRFICEIVNEK